MPGIRNNWLSTPELYDARFIVTFSKNDVTVIYNGKVLLQGWIDITNYLFKLSFKTVPLKINHQHDNQTKPKNDYEPLMTQITADSIIEKVKDNVGEPKIINKAN